jgi:hypothetical protein
MSATLLVVDLVLLDVRPQGGQGFAGSIVLAFVGLALLIILARWTSSKPRKRRPK